MKAESEITKLESVKETPAEEQSVNIRTVMVYVKYFMEHLEDLLLHLTNPVNKAAYFSVLFDKVPTYRQIKNGTQKIAQLPEINELFRVLNDHKVNLVISPGIEPGLPG